MITPEQYSSIRNNYCILYNGNCNEYLLWLKYLRPKIEQQFSGLKLWIVCKSCQLYLFDEEPRIVPIEKYNKDQFAYVDTLTCDMISHPIEKIITESDIQVEPIELIPVKIKTYSIAKNGILPMKKEQIDKIRNYANQRAYEIDVDGDWIIGVESEDLLKNALKGKPITLINGGFGEKLYKKIFPHVEILNINNI